MSDYDFNRMKFNLISGGLAPRHARRAITEIHQHLDELREQGIHEGLSAEQALAQARHALGSEADLTSQFLSRPELKSWPSRYPKLLFILTPLLSYLLLSLTMLVTYIYLAGFIDRPADLVIPGYTYQIGNVILAFCCYLFAPLLALASFITARRYLLPMAWPLVGAVLLTILGAGFIFQITPADANNLGSIGVSWGWSFLPRPLQVESHGMLRMIPVLILLALVASRYQPREFRSAD